MRTILFRAKRIDGDWAIGDYLSEDNERAMAGISWILPKGEHEETQVYTSTVGQFTGRLDKNGKQIFEGDIVKEDLDGAIAVIAFGDYASPFNSDQFTHNIGFYPKWEEKYRRHLRKDLGFYCIYGGVEVIGNVHDNPELWKEEKE